MEECGDGGGSGVETGVEGHVWEKREENRGQK